MHIVIRGIETVFDGFEKNPGPRSIKGLVYCREEIEAQYTEWLASQAGKAADTVAGPTAADDLADGIDRAIEMLRQCRVPALGEDVERAIGRLTELHQNLAADLETVDHALGDIEKILDRALMTKTDSVHLTELEKEIAAELKPYKKGMDAAAYDSTFGLMLLKRLRDEAGIPRLSMFYL